MVRSLRNEHGFTLVEVMVALVIFTIIGVATFSILQKAVAARITAKRVVSELEAVSKTLTQLKYDLAQGTSSGMTRLSGSGDSLRLHGMLLAPGDSLANMRVLYCVAPDEDNKAHSLYRIVTPPDAEAYTTVQLNKVTKWQIDFLQTIGNSARWTSAWRRRQGLPRAIRITLKVASWDEQQEYIYPVRIGRQVEPASQITDSLSVRTTR